MRLYPRFSNSEFSRRYTSIRRMMEKKSVDFVLAYGDLASQADVLYSTNYLPRSPSYALLPKSGEPILLVGFYNHVPNGKAMSVAERTEWAGKNPANRLANAIASIKRGAVTVGISGRVPDQDLIQLRRRLQNCKFRDVTSNLKQIRQVKSEEELDWLRRGATFTDAAIESLAKKVRRGMREHELSHLIESAYLSAGGQTRIHYLSSTSMRKPARCIPWQYPSTRRIRKGDVILTEISASYWGYSGQIHRPISVGQSPPRRYQDLFDVATEAYENVSASLRPGSTEADVLNASSVIDESGFEICDSLVHGFGVDLLPPTLGTENSVYSPPERFVFKENMAMVIQPNPVTPDGKMGIQVGNLTIVSDAGAKSLQKYPMEFIVSN